MILKWNYSLSIYMFSFGFWSKTQWAIIAEARGCPRTEVTPVSIPTLPHQAGTLFFFLNYVLTTGGKGGRGTAQQEWLWKGWVLLPSASPRQLLQCQPSQKQWENRVCGGEKLLFFFFISSNFTSNRRKNILHNNSKLNPIIDWAQCCVLYTLSSLILRTNLWGRYY